MNSRQRQRTPVRDDPLDDGPVGGLAGGEAPASRPPLYIRLEAQPLHQGVVSQITRQIVSGQLGPGSLLPVEPELAERFGVSRTVIREAVRVLVSRGLVAVRHGSGMRVRPQSDWDNLDPSILFEQVRSGGRDQVLSEIVEVRRILEVAVAALAAERRSDEDLERMRSALRGMQETVRDPNAYTQLDIEFHERILAAARNRLLREALRPVNEVLAAGRYISVRVPGAAEKSLRGHEEIYAAIERGDAEAARDAMRSHVRQFESDIFAGCKPDSSEAGEPNE
jgi:GntR family transcriptional regulator, transcriptional repressor for pyruvate dehydrogenase complex